MRRCVRYRGAMNTAMDTATKPVGMHLRHWRQLRRYSQLALAYDAGISPKHLSFVESGRARPSREMLLHLAERLEVPLRERNAMLLAGGFAPAFVERRWDDPDLSSVRQAVDQVLAGHDPYPALAVDRHWMLVAANAGAGALMRGVDEALLQAPVNVLRLSLHPRGLAPRIVNLAQWRAHVFVRLQQQIERSADPVLRALLDELRAYPGDATSAGSAAGVGDMAALVSPLVLRVNGTTLRLISTTMVFGTPLDVTSSELAIESFFPADPETAAVLRAATAG